MSSYFDRMGAPIKPGANPAEHVLETIAPVGGSALDWPGKWKESSEYKALTNAVDLIAGDSKGAALGKSKPDFAASYTEQTTELVRRQTRHQWRNGSYLTSKFVSGIYFGLFIGFCESQSIGFLRLD
jgi:ATP-binding cassette subfamily G (WHITE) protein 2 (SNQ2)